MCSCRCARDCPVFLPNCYFTLLIGDELGGSTLGKELGGIKDEGTISARCSSSWGRTGGTPTSPFGVQLRLISSGLRERLREQCRDWRIPCGRLRATTRQRRDERTSKNGSPETG